MSSRSDVIDAVATANAKKFRTFYEAVRLPVEHSDSEREAVLKAAEEGYYTGCRHALESPHSLLGEDIPAKTEAKSTQESGGGAP